MPDPARPRRDLPPLESNGHALEPTPERLGWLRASDPAEPLEVLRERYRADGYLWLRGLLDPADVLDFRRRYFEAMGPTGLVAPGSDPVEGLYSGTEQRGLPGRVLHEVVRWARYEQFCLSRPILDFYERLFAAPAYLHRRKLIRHSRPGDRACTGAHYDLVYLRGGTDRLCTSWIPIGDVPVERGGLVYLEGSDAWGRRLEADYGASSAGLPSAERVKAYNQFMAAGWLGQDLAALAGQMNGRWLVADYGAGDMVVHSPYMIHASTSNVDPSGRIRLSTDIRFQSVHDAIDPRWQNHWSSDDGL